MDKKGNNMLTFPVCYKRATVEDNICQIEVAWLQEHNLSKQFIVVKTMLELWKQGKIALLLTAKAIEEVKGM